MVRTSAVCLLICAALCPAQENAWLVSERAKEAEKKGNVVEAYLLYAQAAALDPQDRRSWARSLALRTQAMLKANVLPPPSSGPDQDAFAPLEGNGGITDQDIFEARDLRPPPRLRLPAGKKDFDLRGDSRTIWEQVTRAFGLEIVFEAEYQPVNTIHFQMTGVEAREALAALELATASFQVPVSARMVLVARESTDKRQQLEHTIAVTVPLPHPVTLPEAQELARNVQQLMDIQKFGIDSSHRAVVIKDRISKVIPALAVFRQLLQYPSEVELQVEFLEVVENSALDYGLRLPTSIPGVWLSKILNSVPAFPSGFANLVTFGGGASFFGLGVASAEVFATFSEGSTRTLVHADLRTAEGLPAEFHLGDKYPIPTTQYIGDTSSGGIVYAPPPSFNFEDLGIVLKITAKVHDWDDVSLEVDAQYKVLTGESSNGIPVIASRHFLSRARLRSGEWAVLSGLVRASEARSITGLAGVMRIPVLGRMLSQNSRIRTSGQTLFVIKPRLLSEPLSAAETRELWTGTELRPRPDL